MRHTTPKIHRPLQARLRRRTQRLAASLGMLAIAAGNAGPLALAGNPLAADPVALNQPTAQAESFAVYAGGSVKVQIEGDDGTICHGAIFNGNEKFPFTAQRSGSTLSGSFITQKASFAFTLTIEGGSAVFKTDSASYQLVRQMDTAGQAAAGAGAGSAAEPATPIASVNAAAPDDINKLAGGFQLASGSTATGTAAIWAQSDRATSATSLAAQTLRAMTPLFDAPPSYRSGAASSTDDIFEGMFSGHIKGQPVVGMMLILLAPASQTTTAQTPAAPAPRQAWVGVIFDHPTTLQASAGELLRALGDKSPDFVKAVAVASIDNVQPTVLDDGSEIRVPNGWQIVLQAPAAVALRGPQDSAIVLGQMQYVTSPRMAAQYERTLHAPWNPNLPVGDYGDVRSAIKTISNFYNKQDSAKGNVYHLIDIPEVRMINNDPNNQQAQVRTIYEEGPADHPVRYECIGDVFVRRVDQDHWLFFCNAVCAPQSEFAKTLPEMMQIAKSYHCNPQLLVNAQIHLAEVRQQAVEGLVASAMRRMRTSETNFQIVDQIINDQECVTDGAGHKYIVPMSQDKKYIDALNQKFGANFHPVDQLR